MPDLGGRPSLLDPADERDLVRDLTASVLQRMSPDELDVLDETAEEYFADPDEVLTPRGDEAVGFGLEAALLTPVILSVATSVVRFVGGLLADALKESTQPAVVRTLRRLLHLRPDGSAAVRGEVPALTADQVRRVHAVALQRATDLGLPAGEARVLADSVAGGLVVPA